MAVFAGFFAPVDPIQSDASFMPPESVSFHDKDGNLAMPRVYPLVDSEKLDPVTFQPISGPDFDNPRMLGFFVSGFEYKLLGFIPATIHFFGSTDGKPVHFLGTDKLGRDILSRAIYGSRIFADDRTDGGHDRDRDRDDCWHGFGLSRRAIRYLAAAFCRTGPRLSAIAALSGLDLTDPRHGTTNVFLAFVIVVMSVLGWAQMSREVRGKTLALARIEYVKAAIAIGATDRRIIFQHIFPNVMSHVIVAVTLNIPNIVLLESFLGFLGFAVKPPLISWGLMLQDTANYSVIGSYPWILAPVGFVLITVFAFNALATVCATQSIPIEW